MSTGQAVPPGVDVPSVIDVVIVVGVIAASLVAIAVVCRWLWRHFLRRLITIHKLIEEELTHDTGESLRDQVVEIQQVQQEMRKELNGRLTQLVEEVGSRADAQGEARGRADERSHHDE